MSLKFRIKKSFDFDDHKQWDLYIGESFEGEITWHGPKHELVVSGDTTVGYHVMMMGENSGRRELCEEVCQEDTFEKALYKAETHFIMRMLT